MPLPNLIIPGAGKSGTSSLHDYLGQHPDIFMSRTKEPHFFSDDVAYARGPSEYAALFASAGGAPVRGESSTTYMHFPRVPERIAATLDDPRFIFLLRNPVDRTWSHYRWLAGMGLEPRPLRDAVEADLDETPDFKASLGGNYRYYAAESRYGAHLARYLETFGSGRILVLSTEQLRGSAPATLARCADFLGLGTFPAVRPTWTNPTPSGRGRSSVALISDRRPARVARRTLRRLSGLPVVRDVRARRGARRSLRGQAGLAPSDRAWLSKLFADDVSTLRALTACEFAEWAADFPLGGLEEERSAG